jgi:hypothetical protein
MHAGKYTTFARHAFASQIGKTVNITWEDNMFQKQTGRLIDAVVSNDGTKVDVTVEVADSVLAGMKIW